MIADTQVAVTAYAAEQPVSTTMMIASEDYSLFIPPLGSVPFPLVRPALQ
jgi:hypothetical protein